MNSFLVKQPVITEKSLQLAQIQNAFTFVVDRGATKEQIKDLVEKLYKVNVVSVNTIVGHRSLKATGKRRLKMTQPKIKKAVVKLKPGQKIELFDIQGSAEPAVDAK